MSLLVINTLPAATVQATIDRLTGRSADSRVIHTDHPEKLPERLDMQPYHTGK